MSDAEWGIHLSPRAEKDIDCLDPRIRARVLAALDRLLRNDASLDVRRMSGSPEQRVRVGDWRIRFTRDAQQRLIVVQRVLPRGRAYDR